MGISSSVHNFVPGAVGPFIDELPLVNHANVKPYIIAILLHRGGVSFGEIVDNMTPHCPQVDLKVGFWDEIDNAEVEDKTRLEVIIEEVLGEMVCSRLLRYNEELDIWVLNVGENNQNLPTIINWVSSTGAKLPDHILLEMTEQELKKINEKTQRRNN